MPRRRRCDKINGLDFAAIKERAGMLDLALANACLSLAPFEPHYDAILVARTHLVELINVLQDRPAEWREPHAAPMSRG